MRISAQYSAYCQRGEGPGSERLPQLSGSLGGGARRESEPERPLEAEPGTDWKWGAEGGVMVDLDEITKG